MAQNLMRNLVSAVFILSGELPLAVMAEGLSDPTRPSLQVNDYVSSQPVTFKSRGLQSVIISQSHCAAIIDGKTVELGGSHGNETLVEINERGVVLQGNNGRRFLALFPSVAMKINETTQPVKQLFKCQQGQEKQESTPEEITGQKEKK